MKLNKHFNKIGVKVALIIIGLLAGLFVLLNFLAVDRGERAFHDVYRIIVDRGGVPAYDAPLIGPFNDQGFPGRPFNGQQEMTPPEHFKNKFQLSLLLIGLIALLGAVGIAFLISKIITRPLNKLGTGLKKLRASHYKLRLDENNSEEFNTLIKEFNGLAAELERAEELRKNLISDTSHELKTPLASLVAQLEGIEDGVLTFDQERVKLLREQVVRLYELTEGLQDYASLRSHFIKPQFKNLRLKEVLDKIMEQFKDQLADKKITVRVNISDDYALTADPSLLTRVFTNLLDNAIRYSQAKNITIAATKEQITIADDGVGIPEQHLQDIFERFFRLEKSRNRKTGGLGLGLAIIREIIESHGWKIHARIPENNQGVEFVIDL
ncbi:MAG: ATP-binding protein [Patescibacteria group bacterium]|nr:ATP-binding protein [Patescibacteria group bacterium]